jgi:Phage integrase family
MRLVDHFNGKPVAWANTRAWREALKRAGIKDFRWHDLHDTWASWLVQRGAPSNVVQEVGAWESDASAVRSLGSGKFFGVCGEDRGADWRHKFGTRDQRKRA